MNELDCQRISYPRVSEIIEKQNWLELRSVPIEFLANAAIRGQKVHSYCLAHMHDLWVGEIEPEYEPYVNAFLEWTKENVFQTLYTSTRLYDDCKKFTGEFDMIVILKESKQIALVDIKTSASVSKTWPLQLAAYKHLCEVNDYGDIETSLNLHLKKKKSAVFEKSGEEKVLISPPHVHAVAIEHKNLNPYWDIFSSALSCYDYFERKETAHVCV